LKLEWNIVRETVQKDLRSKRPECRRETDNAEVISKNAGVRMQE
jgi:hypothetical protein